MSETIVVRYRGEYSVLHSSTLRSLPCDDLETSCKGDIRIFIFDTAISYYIFLHILDSQTFSKRYKLVSFAASPELSGKQYHVLVDIIQLFSDI